MDAVYDYIRTMIRRYLNWRTLLLIIAIGIISGSVLYSRYLAKKIESEERQRVEEWIQSNKLQMSTAESEAINMVALIQKDNEDIPLIGTDEKDNILDVLNLDSARLKTNPNYFREKLEEFKSQHQPIVYEISRNPYIANKIYYGNSKLLNEVRYYPIIQLIIVALFIAIALSLLITQNKSTQNQVWAGMAKETAHQMGTPLTSLQGWIEMLKDVAGTERIVPEMEKDMDRLKLVSDRFGKIGSTPQLIATNLAELIEKVQQYIRHRASEKVKIYFNKPSNKVMALVSPPLFEWVLENLLKNALDAMKGKGTLTIHLNETTTNVFVDITDTGKGINQANIKKIFKPGYTTKKRGWGLGLTLSKRIMKQYHKGELYVKNSEIGKGTTFRIVINK